MKRPEIMSALKLAGIAFKGNMSNAVLLSLLPENQPVAVEVVAEKITFTIGIDQKGLTDEGITNQILFESTFMQGDEALNLRKIAGNFATKLFAAIKLLPKRGKGYNLSLLVDNQLVATQRHKVEGRVNFSNPVDLAHGLLLFIAAQFDSNTGEELFGEGVNNSGEIRLLARKFKLNENLPFILMHKGIDSKRKAVKAELKAIAE